MRAGPGKLHHDPRRHTPGDRQAVPCGTVQGMTEQPIERLHDEWVDAERAYSDEVRKHLDVRRTGDQTPRTEPLVPLDNDALETLRRLREDVTRAAEAYREGLSG